MIGRALAATLLAALAAGGAAACAPSEPDPSPAASAAPCRAGAGDTAVQDAAGLAAALREARPGTRIVLADGVYPGRFTATAAGSESAPVTVCGGRGAILDGGPVERGYALHLDGADHWRLSGFSVRGAQKGVVVDRSQHVLVDGLAVTDVGDEAVHLRAGSSDGIVRGTVVRRTGLHEPRFGEGVYVGSARSNWCRWTACGPDRSDRAVVEGNDIAETTAEAVDVKEGTTGGVLRGNRFSGSSTTDADSWVDVKGNGWVVEGNTGVQAPEHGFQVHVVEPGWGSGTMFRANVATVDADGYGFEIDRDAVGTVVGCDNVVTGAARGLADVPCS